MRTIVGFIVLSLCGISEARACGSHEARTPASAQSAATTTAGAPPTQPSGGTASAATSAPKSLASLSADETSTPVSPSVKLSWKASVPLSKLPRDVIAGYNIYRSESPHVKCTAANKIATVGGSATSYTDRHVQAGKTYYYVATATAASTKESDHPSNEATATIK